MVAKFYPKDIFIFSSFPLGGYQEIVSHWLQSSEELYPHSIQTVVAEFSTTSYYSHLPSFVLRPSLGL
jgi:hypothetical protein